MVKKWKKFWNEEIETMPKDKLKNLQLKKLLAQLNYVYHYSKFYNKKFREAGVSPDDIKSFSDFDKVPMTYKDEIRAERDKTGDPFGGTLCTPLSDEIITIHASTGTTGLPTIFAYTREDLTVASEQEIRLKWMRGWRPGDFVIGGAFRWHGYIPIHFLGVDRIGIKSVGDCGYPLPNIMDKHIQIMKTFKPTILAGPTLYIYALVEAAKRLGEDFKKLCENVRIIDTGYGDIVTKTVKRKLEDETGIPIDRIYDFGGIADPLWYFGDCEMHAGLHSCDDLFLVEIRDPRTHEPVAEGERGEIVVTNLFAKATPVIKWGAEDIGFISTEKCGCGRTHTRVTFLGREAFAVNIKGKVIFPSEVENALADVPGFTEWFTIYKYKPFPLDKLKIKIAVDFTKVKDENEFKKAISEKAMESFGAEAEVEIAKSISELPFLGHKVQKLVDLTKKT